MTDLNRIGFNPQIHMPKIQPKTDEAKKEVQEETPRKPQTNYKSASDVLGFMAQTSTMPEMTSKTEAKSTRKIEVSKFVTPDQAKRIAGFVQEFTSAVEEGLKSFEAELGHLPEYKAMSEDAKMEVALSAFLKNNMPDVENEPI